MDRKYFFKTIMEMVIEATNQFGFSSIHCLIFNLHIE